MLKIGPSTFLEDEDEEIQQVNPGGPDNNYSILFYNVCSLQLIDIPKIIITWEPD